MKHTNETLRTLYLTDLKLPDAFHGRTAPKVRHFSQWKAIVPYCAHSHPLTIDPFGDRDIWLWSDTHFGHTNIIKYCNRPFPSANAMDECMIRNYLSVVKPNDIVIWGGDIGFKSPGAINEILNQLPGYKIQIIGNHDIRRGGSISEYAVDERHLCYVIDINEHDMEYQLLITHYPLDAVPKNSQNIHGHIHQNIAMPWNTNISVEHTNYAPINLKLLLPSIKQKIVIRL